MIKTEKLREIARHAVSGEVVQGEEAGQVLELMTGDDTKWQLGVAIALEYLENGDIETAKKVLGDMLVDEDVDSVHVDHDPRFRIKFDFDVRGESPQVIVQDTEDNYCEVVEVFEEPRLTAATWSWDEDDWEPGSFASWLLDRMNAES